MQYFVRLFRLPHADSGSLVSSWHSSGSLFSSSVPMLSSKASSGCLRSISFLLALATLFSRSLLPWLSFPSGSLSCSLPPFLRRKGLRIYRDFNFYTLSSITLLISAFLLYPLPCLSRISAGFLPSQSWSLYSFGHSLHVSVFSQGSTTSSTSPVVSIHVSQIPFGEATQNGGHVS